MDNNQNITYWPPSQEPSTSASSVASSPPVNVDSGDAKKGSKSAKPKRFRIIFTSRQMVFLEEEFAGNKFLSRQRRTELASYLALTERQIKVWFQNRRMKNKKDLQPAKEKQRQRRRTSSDDFDNVSYDDGNHSLVASLPPVNVDSGDAKKGSKYARAKRFGFVFTNREMVFLEEEFARNKFLPRQRRIELAADWAVSERQITVWFQNRRMKNKKNIQPDKEKQRQRRRTSSSAGSLSPRSDDFDNVSEGYGNHSSCSNFDQSIIYVQNVNHVISGNNVKNRNSVNSVNNVNSLFRPWNNN